MGDPRRRCLAFRTRRRPFVRWSNLAVGGGVFFQKKCRQFFTQQTGHVLSLSEGHQTVLVRLSEHPFKGLSGT